MRHRRGKHGPAQRRGPQGPRVPLTEDWRCEWCQCTRAETRARTKGPNGSSTLCHSCGCRHRRGGHGPAQPPPPLTEDWRCEWCQCTRAETRGRLKGPSGSSTLCKSCGERHRRGKHGPSEQRRHDIGSPRRAPSPAATPRPTKRHRAATDNVDSDTAAAAAPDSPRQLTAPLLPPPLLFAAALPPVGARVQAYYTRIGYRGWYDAEVTEVTAEGAVRVRYVDDDDDAPTSLIEAAAVATRIAVADDTAQCSLCLCAPDAGEVALPCCSAAVCVGCAGEMTRKLEGSRCPFCRKRLSMSLVKAALREGLA